MMNSGSDVDSDFEFRTSYFPRSQVVPMTLPPNPRILVVRLSALGDILHVLPAVAALRRGLPGAKIGWLVEDRFRALLEGQPFLDAVHVFDRKTWPRAVLRGTLGPHVAEIRDAGYEAVLDFQGNLKSALHLFLSGIPVRYGFGKGYSREGSRRFLTHPVIPQGIRISRVEKNLSLVRAMGIPAERPEYPGLILPEAAVTAASAFRGETVRGGASGLAILHPGTSTRGGAKRWPPDRFAKLATALRGLGFVPCVTWGPGERELAEGVVRDSSRAAVLAPATASILDLAALIAAAKLFIAADSGPLHLAHALGVPCVGVYGPKDPRIYAPSGGNVEVVFPGDIHAVAAKDRGDTGIAMDGITVEMVFEAVGRSLRKTGGCNAHEG